jgi:hypothetical protein
VQGVPARTALALLVAGAVALGGCGGDDDGNGSGKAERPANLPADFNIQLFNCSDWKESDEEIRRYVVRRLEEIVGGQITGQGANGRGSTLTEEQAHRLFDGTCGGPQARGFLLYKLYGHAAGFGGGAY